MPIPHFKDQRGFTLVELLVALMLLAFIALGLGGAMRTISQTQERVDSRMQRSERQSTALQFLRTTLARSSGQRRLASQARPGESPYYFLGQPQEVQWLGSMPLNLGGQAGRIHFRLSLQGTGQGQSLVLQYKSWDKNESSPDWSSASSYVLESDVIHFSLRYQQISRSQGMQWHPQWDAAEHSQALPTAIHIEISTAQGDWPLTVLTFSHPMAAGGTQGGGHVIGGSR